MTMKHEEIQALMMKVVDGLTTPDERKAFDEAISGNENIPRRGSLWLHPGEITVQKLPALDAAQYQTLGPFKLKILAKEMIQQHLNRMEEGMP